MISNLDHNVDRDLALITALFTIFPNCEAYTNAYTQSLLKI